MRDTGPGIPAEALPRIFDRFYRADQARSRGAGGAGLGLCIAKTIAELHGGRIEVESPPGAGSTFRVLLPVLQPEQCNHTTEARSTRRETGKSLGA